MTRPVLCLLIALALAPLGANAATRAKVEDTIAQRVAPCTTCHGEQGRATNEGYFPRIAGKPAGYLYNQLVNFREGRRTYALMTYLVDHLTDDYLREIAGYFAGLELPYQPPQRSDAPAALMSRGEALVRRGDGTRKIAACTACHGEALTGVEPAVPGLLGLSRDYLQAQIGHWKSGERRAVAPDCMAKIASQLTPEEVGAISWVAGFASGACRFQAVASAAHQSTARLRKRVEVTLKRSAAAVVALFAALAASVAALNFRGEESIADDGHPFSPTVEQISRGEYLALAGNCAGCHTTRGGAPYSGGLAVRTPFGTVSSSNLTPDRKTGIGTWTPAYFWRALHNGRSKDGRLLYPAFPYPNYTSVTREDADAIFAYLTSLPAVEQTNKPHALRFPYNTQAALAVWRALFFKPGTFEADASKPAEWNRGAYLVHGLGHCVACHSPRNALGATSDKLELSGGLVPMLGWYAPSLASSSEAGVADWDTSDVVALLKTGLSRRGSVMGPMAEVVFRSTQYLSDSDLTAMAAYLKSLPPIPPQTAEPAQVADAAPDGAKLYEQHCASCHGDSGEGATGAYPALAGNRAVTMAIPANVVRVVLSGGYLPATAGNPRPFGMPPFSHVLDDAAMAAVVSFIRSAWGNRAEPVSRLEVMRSRAGED